MIQMIDIQANTQSWTLPETQVSTIEAAFQEFTERRDIGILLINQHVGLSSIMDVQSYPVEFLLFRLRRRYGLLWTSTNKHSPHYLKYPLKTFHMVSHSFLVSIHGTDFLFSQIQKRTQYSSVSRNCSESNYSETKSYLVLASYVDILHNVFIMHMPS